MNEIGRFEKSPWAALPYTVDWSQWLPVGETIASVQWTVPTGLTQANAGNTTTTATVRLSGGTIGAGYRVCCRITTTPSAYVEERSIFVECKER
jgi:hypothetical protein